MLTYCPDKNTSKFSIELSLKEKVLGCHNHDEKILEFMYNISQTIKQIKTSANYQDSTVIGLKKNQPTPKSLLSRNQ